MTERFERAYNALVNAFFNGTLTKGDCRTCAVGNIVGDAQERTGDKKLPRDFWGKLFYTDILGNSYINTRGPKGKINRLKRKLISLTGYSVESMQRIERAFETNTEILFTSYYMKTQKEILEDQYNGLCAVVDVLLDIDALKEDAEPYKAKFREHKALCV